jgi:predicted glycosyltransferase
MKKLLIEVGHPAHVHQFKYLYQELTKLSWDVKFVAKDKDIVLYLLEKYGIPFFKLGKTSPKIARKILSIPAIDLKYHKFVKSFKPDLIISRVSPYSGHVSFINRIPHISFTDTENVQLLDLISAPFANYIFTSTSFKRDYGKKQIRYPGTHELAYLHPNRFTPDSKILKDLMISNEERFFILRFVNWSAHHDIGHKGLKLEQKINLVDELNKYGKVFITAEGDIPKQLEKFKIRISPESVHDALYFATMYIGESSTMAEEAAVLGTPSIYISTSATLFGVIEDLQQAALLQYYHPDNFLQIMDDIKMKLTSSDLKISSSKDLKHFLQKKIDVTAFMVWLVVNFPSSIERLKDDPDFVNSFK